MNANLKNSTTFAADALSFAKKESEAKAGAMYMAHTHSTILLDLAARIGAKKEDEAVREIVLNHWRSYPEGEAFEKKKKAFPATKDRSPAEHATFNAMLRWETNINTQTLRAIDVALGVSILRKQGRDVIIEKIEGTKEWQCNVRSEGMLKERHNTPFTVKMLGNVPSIAKTITAKTPTHDISKKAKSGKDTTPNKVIGSVERIDQSKMAEVLKQVDTSLTAYVKPDGSLALSANAITQAKHVFAHLHFSLSDKDKADAIAEYKSNADNAKASAKVVAPAPAAPAATVKVATLPKVAAK